MEGKKWNDVNTYQAEKIRDIMDCNWNFHGEKLINTFHNTIVKMSLRQIFSGETKPLYLRNKEAMPKNLMTYAAKFIKKLENLEGNSRFFKT